MTGLPERTVEVRGEKYTFRLVPALEAFDSLRKITAKVSTLGPSAASLWAHDNNRLNESINSIIMDDIKELIETFIDMEQLKVGDKKVLIGGEDGFNEHFSGKPLAIGELLFKVILENDRDFFHSLPSFVKKGWAWLNTQLQNNSLKLPEEVNNAINNAIEKMEEKVGSNL